MHHGAARRSDADTDRLQLIDQSTSHTHTRMTWAALTVAPGLLFSLQPHPPFDPSFSFRFPSESAMSATAASSPLPASACAADSAVGSSGQCAVDRLVSFLSFNICLFPVGMRHSWPVADKMVRMRQYMELLQQHHRRRRRRHGRGRSGGRVTVTASAPDDDDSSSSSSHWNGDDESAHSVSMREQPISVRRHKAPQSQPLLHQSIVDGATAAAACSAAVDPSELQLLAGASPSDLSLQLASLLSADIVCLQEIFSSGCSSRWRTLLEQAVERGQLGYAHVAFGRPSSLARMHIMDSGLAILSRWPIRHQSFHPFHCNPGVLRFADKGFIHAVIEIEHKQSERQASEFEEQQRQESASGASPAASASSGSSGCRLLHVFNTHLHPGEGSATAEAARAARRVQVQQLRAYMQAQGLLESAPASASSSTSATVHGAHPVEPARSSFIVLGDFNMEEGSEEHAEMLRTWECDAAPLLGQPTQHMSHVFCNHGPLIAGDFAVARNLRWSQAEVITQACALSDHFPVRYAASISADT